MCHKKLKSDLTDTTTMFYSVYALYRLNVIISHCEDVAVQLKVPPCPSEATTLRLRPCFLKFPVQFVVVLHDEDQSLAAH